MRRHWCTLTLCLLLTSCVARATASSDIKKIIMLGDSLTEGYGVSKDKAYPALVQKKLEKVGKKFLVVNAGISGSTSASAPSRMAWQLKSKPYLIFISLGANDGLRGQPVDKMEENLTTAIVQAQKAGVKVILGGMRLPPNYGAEYTDRFAAAFAKVARKTSVPLLPFILEGVGGDPKLNLADGIHPNEKGHEIVATTVFQFLEKHL